MTKATRCLCLALALAAGPAGCGGTGGEAAGPAAPPAPQQPHGSTAAPADRCAAKVGRDLVALVGDWSGDGWIEMQPGQREQFTQTEAVRCALGGEIVVIEGRGSSRVHGQPDKVVHQAIGVVSHDPAAASYRMRAYASGRPAVDSDLGVSGDGVFTWGFEHGPVKIRFRIHVAGDAWHETGEISISGGPWRQFFEMRLRRAAVAS
jgi:hypothetical protein